MSPEQLGAAVNRILRAEQGDPDRTSPAILADIVRSNTPPEPTQPLENPNVGTLLINNAVVRQADAKRTKGPALQKRLAEQIPVKSWYHSPMFSKVLATTIIFP